MNNVIVSGIYFIVILCSFLIGKYIFPKIKKTDIETVRWLSEWAYKLVVNARNLSVDSMTGAEKKDMVELQLIELAKSYNIKISNDQISALIEDAYNTMKEASGK